MSNFDADGRRQLFGLSQAIRKHAHQSTSPSSENVFDGKPRLRQEKMGSAKNKTKSAPTIEDKLLSLFNSDTEGAENQSASNSTKLTLDKPPTFELGSKGYHGSYSPRLAESKMRAERLKRTTGSDLKDVSDANPPHIHLRTRSLSSESVLKDAPLRVTVSSTSNSPPSSVCESRTSCDTNCNRLRRCASAVPASFSDENWNVVPESPKALRERTTQSPNCPNSPPLTPSTLGRRTPAGAYNLAIWDQRPPPSPSRLLTLSPNSPISHSPKQPSSPISWTPRSYTEPTSRSNDCTRRTLEYTPSSLPAAARDRRSPGKFLFRVGSPAHLSLSPSSGQDLLRFSNPASPCSVSQSRQGSIERRARPIQYVEPPSPAGIRTPSTMPRSCKSPPEELKVSSLVTTSTSTPPTPKSAPPAAVKRDSQNSSSANHKPDVKCTPDKDAKPVKNTDCTHDDDPESCKSEDRDSGAILDAEPSVFDFDSSVLSESENETPHVTVSIPEQNTPKINTRESIWSRSSTPTLPPLSPYDSEVDTPRIISPPFDRDACHKDTVHVSPITKNKVARLPSYDSLLRKKAADSAKKQRNVNEMTSIESHDHNELSPTESALAESCDMTDGITGTKNLGYKVPIKKGGNKNSRRRNSRTSSRASSCDERRVITKAGKHRVGKRSGKHKSKRRQPNSEEYTYYDIENSALTKKQLSSYPVFYRPGEDENPAGSRDPEETSSVKSFTSASIASSAIRKYGRKHHRRHHQSSGAIDKAYAKEVRAVNKRFTRLEAHVVTLARNVAQLSSEVRQQVEMSHDLEDLRTQVEELRREKTSSSRKSSTSSHAKTENQKKSFLLKAQPKKVVKLTKFFGEKPPILSIFLAQMGYEKYVKNFKAESIGMVELAYMDEERLKSIGIPLGPRLRILNEAKKTCFV